MLVIQRPSHHQFLPDPLLTPRCGSSLAAPLSAAPSSGPAVQTNKEKVATPSSSAKTAVALSARTSSLTPKHIEWLLCREVLWSDFLDEPDHTHGVTESGRRSMLHTLHEICRELELPVEVFSSSTNYFDTMLAGGSWPGIGNLSIALACLTIAAEQSGVCEETLGELTCYECCSPQEGRDAKRAVWMQLEAAGPRASPNQFLAACNQYSSSNGPVRVMEKILQACAFEYELLSFRGPVLALAAFAIAYELSSDGGPPADTEELMEHLQVMRCDLESAIDNIYALVLKRNRPASKLKLIRRQA